MTSTLTPIRMNGDRVCAATTCRTLIKKLEDDCFMDDLAPGTVYCDRCGVMLRFHRKRAAARGEAPPVTFEHVDERMNRK